MQAAKQQLAAAEATEKRQEATRTALEQQITDLQAAREQLAEQAAARQAQPRSAAEPRHCGRLRERQSGKRSISSRRGSNGSKPGSGSVAMKGAAAHGIAAAAAHQSSQYEDETTS